MILKRLMNKVKLSILLLIMLASVLSLSSQLVLAQSAESKVGVTFRENPENKTDGINQKEVKLDNADLNTKKEKRNLPTTFEKVNKELERWGFVFLILFLGHVFIKYYKKKE
ncbi:hypothetical protein RAK27_11290 [Carnobacterium maltaromaticum]|uniref:Gram-positive cocci surface proteins LPxTG domain-containing protein n=1 Tax=Carnobacterium maltaromaticum TaxID=2751 RepID=A0AAW9JR98_CARML|nr:hypothetical protein [Carnobacterium maltaromaticum]MDZ5759245.1 hypothetical protein [Carnobacterium maltaromaticum]